ncbi:MAG: hypothetical protein ACRCXZ_00930 [Patescibacteria group bacterium]
MKYFLAFISLCIAFYFLIGFIIPIPQFNLIENIKTNQPLNFETQNKFWVEVNGNKTYSRTVDNYQRVNLGKINGKNNFKFGGYIDFLGIKFESKNSYTKSLERDFESLDTSVDIPRYFYPDNTNKNYTVKFETIEDVRLFEGDRLVYDSNNDLKICTKPMTSQRSLILVCPITFVNDSAKISLYAQDKAGNKILIASDKLVNVVPKSEVKCDFAEVNGKIGLKCGANKKLKVTNPKNYQKYNFEIAQVQFIEYNFENGKNRIILELEDEYGMKNTFEQVINVMKQ